MFIKTHSLFTQTYLHITTNQGERDRDERTQQKYKTTLLLYVECT